jgi:uncharacterized protein YhaN
VPEVLTLTVVAGGDGDPSASQLEAQEQRLAQLCRQAGAADAADARRLHKIFRQAEQVRAAQRTILKDNLAELTPEALESGLVALRATVAGYLESRGPEPGIADDEAAARVAAAEADSVLATAERDRRVAELDADAAQKLLAELQTASRERAVELRLASEKVEELERALDADRAAASDEQLAARLRDAQADERIVGDQLRVVREQLDREGPDQVRATLENAQATLASVDSELRAIQDGLLEVQTRLRDHGEDGLAEQLDEAVASLASAERDRAQYQSRAAARKILFETLRTEREAARRAYVGPLRQRIDQLGSFVFGSGFGVELDDSLRIVTRTVDGATIPFESLSVGAQEQLGLIARLACAMIVSPDEGVPLILDDALGNSDPQRLEAMGAVLAVAGRHCQIIVLTCQPDRYQHVGGATLVRLA